MILEACVQGFDQALKAEKLGANRIELCENLHEGGTTPSIGTIMACKKYLSIPIVVMIRPRGGHFVYTEAETEIMATDIEACRKAGADGIAIGFLNRNKEVDLAALEKVLRNKGNMLVTFHKAIDVTTEIEKEFLRLAASGLIDRVLSSGGKQTAFEGAAMLNRMITLGAERVKIVVAGKVTRNNLHDLHKLIPAGEFHGKGIVGELKQE